MGYVIGLIIGFIPMSFAIMFAFEVASHDKGYEPGICGCLFLFFSGAFLGGTINSIISGELNIPSLMLFIGCSIVTAILFLIWKKIVY